MCLQICGEITAVSIYTQMYIITQLQICVSLAHCLALLTMPSFAFACLCFDFTDSTCAYSSGEQPLEELHKHVRICSAAKCENLSMSNHVVCT